MSVPATQSANQAQIGEQLAWVREQPEGVQQAILTQVTNEHLGPEAISDLIRAYQEESLNQQSANAEASLVQGGYSAKVATAVGASVGVGMQEQQVQQSAADFARMASQAIANGQTLDEVRFADPNLSLAAQEAIYAQAAQQQGTSPEEIAAKAEASKQADMQAIQNGVFGGLIQGLNLTQLSGPMDMGSTTAALANGTSVQQISAPKPRDQEQGFSLG